MDQKSFTSASGLRPVSAFFVVGAIILIVAGEVVHLNSARAASQPDRTKQEEGLEPAFDIADAKGHILAHFVPRFDLVMSPRSMWQAHTPTYMAEELSTVLGGEPSPLELLDEMMPDAKQGVIEVKAWSLTPRQANRLAEWMASGAGTNTRPLEGIWILPFEDPDHAGPRFRVHWQPERLLSKDERAAHGYDSACAWARRVANGIEGALRRPGVCDPATSKDWDERRAAVWKALIPRANCRPVEGIPAALAPDVRDVLATEAVAPWQMHLAYDRKREYPCGEHELFGDWGYTNPDQKEPLPRGGLELLCSRLLEGEEWAFLDRDRSAYRWSSDRSVRGRRGDRANGFLDFSEASAEPVVHTTLDLGLQRVVRAELEEILEVHEPALAMAIVVDVATGDVLAVESIEEYEITPFAPVYHAFTPGSTMKVMTMACALEEGVVRPDEPLEVGHGEYRLVDPATGKGRIIREAEGSLKGRNTAQMFFAKSVNAAMVQIGVRVDDEKYHEYLTRLGYGQAVESGLGKERCGYLAPTPWKYRFTHASVSFGHEMTTTLWQHAAALASVLRGGRYLPLRLVRGVEQAGEWYDVPLEEGHTVFSADTCEQVRAMMRLGAEQGTGKSISRPDVIMGTKTGTAQKVHTELCLHVELPAIVRWQNDDIGWTHERYAALKHVPKPHHNCYTSSMCVFGRLPDGDQEVMVLVVVDEPRGREKYGSKVAGPAAAAILAEALGLTHHGEEPTPEYIDGFNESSLELRNAESAPWRPTGGGR